MSGLKMMKWKSTAFAIAAVLVLLSGALAQDRLPTSAPRDRIAETGQGLGVDASGKQAIDPSENVKALSEAATKRQDDLREASERFILQQIESAEKLNSLRSMNSQMLREAESRRIDGIIELRADFQAQLAAAEAKRIDAIRAVDVNAVSNATESAAERATVLAQNVDTSAETMRTLVASTAQSIANANEQSTAALSNRITALEQQQYLGQGRQTLSDPALTALADQVQKLTTSQTASTGEATGSASTIAFIFAGIGGLVGLIAIGGLIWKLAQTQVAVGNGNGNGNYQPNGRRRK